MATFDNTPPDSSVEPMTEKINDEWLRMAAQTVCASAGPNPCSVNAALEEAIGKEPQSPVAPAYRLWIADNMVREGEFARAVKAFDQVIELSQRTRAFAPRTNVLAGALRHKAGAAARQGDRKVAIAAYCELAKISNEEAPEAMLQAGMLAEDEGDDVHAADLYRTVARDQPCVDTDDAAELARRSLLRLKDSKGTFLRSSFTLADLLTKALERRSIRQLDQLITNTHFSVGPLGGHTGFESPELVEALYKDLAESSIKVRRTMIGAGRKLYLQTSGWKGEWYRGNVVCLLHHTPKGWQWVGIGITKSHEMWRERWRPEKMATNDPLPFSIEAPWPLGQSFTAGGYELFAAQVLNPALYPCYARSACGFGPRGYYYNALFSHKEEDSFAIDFTRYQRDVPFDNESGNTPVLAVRDGYVVKVVDNRESGDSEVANRVEIVHQDPNAPTTAPEDGRFRSRYLHFAGPGLVPVSEMMPVIRGQRLGLMDDTGNSVMDHLHFSIHDKNISHPNVSYGASVRPTPMSGVRLGDGDTGKCVRSNNLERELGFNISPLSVAFGQVAQGDIKTKAIAMENTSGATVTVSVAASSGVIYWPALNADIDHGQTRYLIVEFAPTGEGSVSKTLTINSTDADSPHIIPVSGTGLGSGGGDNGDTHPK